MKMTELDLTADDLSRLHLSHLISQGLSSVNGLPPLYANCTDEIDPKTREKRLMGLQMAVDLSNLPPEKTKEVLHWVAQLFSLLEDCRSDVGVESDSKSEPKITILSA
jgi:hypothetical protein